MYKLVYIEDGSSDYEYGKILSEEVDEEYEKMYKIQLLDMQWRDKYFMGEKMVEYVYPDSIRTIGHIK